MPNHQEFLFSFALRQGIKLTVASWLHISLIMIDHARLQQGQLSSRPSIWTKNDWAECHIVVRVWCKQFSEAQSSFVCKCSASVVGSSVSESWELLGTALAHVSPFPLIALPGLLVGLPADTLSTNVGLLNPACFSEQQDASWPDCYKLIPINAEAFRIADGHVHAG